MLAGCEMKREGVESKEVLDSHLDEFFEIILLDEKYENVSSKNMEFEMIDNKFHAGVGKMHISGDGDEIFIISACDNEKNEYKSCGVTGAVLKNGNDLFFNHNIVKVNKDTYHTYYYGVVEGETTTVKYKNNELQTKTEKIELNSEIKYYTLWIYKTTIDEDFDEYILEFNY